MGMAFAARLSGARGLCRAEVAERVIRLLKRAGLPVTIPKELIGRQLGLAIETDKKASDGKIKFVCLDDIGQARFEYMTADEVVRYAAHER